MPEEFIVRPEGPAAKFSNRQVVTRAAVEQGLFVDLEQQIGDQMHEELLRHAEETGYDIFGIVHEVEYEGIDANSLVVFTTKARGLTRDKDALWQAVIAGTDARAEISTLRIGVADLQFLLRKTEDELHESRQVAKDALDALEYLEAVEARPWWRRALRLPPKTKDEE